MPAYFFIVNPSAARGKCARVGEQLKKRCKELNLDFDLVFTAGPRNAMELASKASESYDCIVAVGGDGTVNETANGVFGKNVKFGIIPVGSGNDFTHALKIPDQYEKALQKLIKLQTRKIDVGLAKDRYFVNGLGIGFDAWVVEESLKVKRLRGNLIYLYSVLKTIYSYTAPEIEVEFNGSKIKRKLFMVSVGNGVSMGGGFKLTPDALLDDGYFDVLMINELNHWEVYQNLLGVYSGKHLKMPQVTLQRTAELMVTSSEGFAAHVDGELLSLNLNELNIRIFPGAMEVVV